MKIMDQILKKPKRRQPRREPKTHDYTQPGWGHDCTFDPKDGGDRAEMSGWGHGIEIGDRLKIKSKANKSGSAVYEVTKISYCHDPGDMWFASVKWIPRRNCETCGAEYFEPFPEQCLNDHD